jgi:hypothetical protein
VYQRGGNLDTWLDTLCLNKFFFKFKEEPQSIYETFPILQIDDSIQLDTTPLIQIAAHLQFWFSKTDELQVTNTQTFDTKLAKLMRQEYFMTNALPYIKGIEEKLRRGLSDQQYQTVYKVPRSEFKEIRGTEYPLLLWGLLGASTPDPIPFLA